MTDRHPMDCYLTPPCAALALLNWLLCKSSWSESGGIAPWLDPFAGPGTLLLWGTPMFKLGSFAFELDARWEPELKQRVDAFNMEVGRDSFARPWTVRGRAPHLITNPPFGRTLEAVSRASEHARSTSRWACLLMRTDWWQHPGRGHLAPDHFCLMQWRPVFGLNKHGKFGTDYAGYAWCVWEPQPTGACRMHWLERPLVPGMFVSEHRRLARMAHEMGATSAHGG